jgi:hypothetical protein
VNTDGDYDVNALFGAKKQMLKKIELKENEVVGVQLNPSLFTLAQMRVNGIMQFFDVSKSNNDWSGLDLNTIPALFYLFVAEKNMGSLFVEKIPSNVVTPSKIPVPKIMLTPIIGDAGKHGAKLIELTDEYSSYEAKVLKDNLDPTEDRDLIYTYELCGMYGDPKKIGKRLERYFESGINWDDSKKFLFPDIPLPPANYRPASKQY